MQAASICLLSVTVYVIIWCTKQLQISCLRTFELVVIIAYVADFEFRFCIIAQADAIAASIAQHQGCNCCIFTQSKQRCWQLSELHQNPQVQLNRWPQEDRRKH